jgi:hypothetical protein
LSTEAENNAAEAPEPPASAAAHSQHAPTGEQPNLVVRPQISTDVIQGGLPSALVGLAATSPRLSLSPIAIAGFVTAFNEKDARIRELDELLREERDERRNAERALSDMRSRADIAETSLRAANEVKPLRDIALAVGGASLSAALGLYDKLGAVGTIGFAAIGVALLAGVYFSRSRPGAGK